MSEAFDAIEIIYAPKHSRGNFTIILNEIAEKEVGVFRHRQTPMYVNDANGLFNVGVVHFKQTPTGRDALEWWTHAVLHRKYPHLATCGDQKYLDAFLNLPRDKLFIDGNIGHGAPWLWQLYDYTDFFKDGSIIWENTLPPGSPVSLTAYRWLLSGERTKNEGLSIPPMWLLYVSAPVSPLRSYT